MDEKMTEKLTGGIDVSRGDQAAPNADKGQANISQSKQDASGVDASVAPGAWDVAAFDAAVWGD